MPVKWVDDVIEYGNGAFLEAHHLRYLSLFRKVFENQQNCIDPK